MDRAPGEGAQEGNSLLNGKALQEGRDMICFCIKKNNRGSRNHIFSIITPSVSLSPLFLFPVSLSISCSKKFAFLHQSKRLTTCTGGLITLMSVSFVRITYWDINLFCDDQRESSVGRCIHGGSRVVAMVEAETSPSSFPRAGADFMK